LARKRKFQAETEEKEKRSTAAIVGKRRIHPYGVVPAQKIERKPIRSDSSHSRLFCPRLPHTYSNKSIYLSLRFNFFFLLPWLASPSLFVQPASVEGEKKGFSFFFLHASQHPMLCNISLYHTQSFGVTCCMTYKHNGGKRGKKKKKTKTKKRLTEHKRLLDPFPHSLSSHSPPLTN
jgi:hypothetical protein